MIQPRTATVLSAILGSAIVVTYNQYFKPLLDDRTAHSEPMASHNQAPEQSEGKKAIPLLTDEKSTQSIIKTHGEPIANHEQASEQLKEKKLPITASSQTDEFTQPIIENGRFKNPWKAWRHPGFLRFVQAKLTTGNESSVPSKQELDETLPIQKPDIGEFDRPLQSGVRMMWIGHATIVAQLDGFTVMTDPVFSQRASVSQLFGPKRYRDPPCSIEELPKLDAVVISHNHYDHLDYGSVLALNKRFGKDLKWFVPVGLKRWMNDAGCENVVEMTWWEEHALEGSRGVRVACTPCQHWCKRGAMDDNKVLWSSWCVMGPNHSFHFAGDTGYCEGFQQIGRKYGPFTAAAIPIGAYHPRWFMSPQHVDPAQAVDIHTDIQSKYSVGIHWGTFVLTDEHYLEPQKLLKEEVEKHRLSPDSFVTVHHGAISIFGSDNYDKVD